MTRRVFVDPWRDGTRTRQFSQNIRTEQPYTVDFSASATARGTSASSVSWASVGSRELTISNEALSSGVATADVASNNGGYGKLRVEATYADGNTENVYLQIDVEDAEYQV